MKVKIDKTTVKLKVENAFNRPLALLSEEILNDCNQYCKEDTGALIQSSLIHSEPSRGQLIWQTPYARRQYWEIRTAYADVNPHASWKWCEVAKRLHLSQWERQAQKLFKENLK